MVVLVSVVAAVAIAVPSALGAGGKVSVKLSEFKLVPGTKSVTAGKVVFTVKNAGKLKHEFLVVKANLAPGKLPVKNGRASEKGSAGEIGDIAPGRTATKTFTLKVGKYVLLCNLSGHYKAGQYAGFTVR